MRWLLRAILPSNWNGYYWISWKTGLYWGWKRYLILPLYLWAFTCKGRDTNADA